MARTFEESWVQVFPPGPEYHLTVYVDVPPLHDPVRVIDCPLSIEGDAGVTVGTVRAPFTVTVSVTEFTVTGVFAESVTPMQYPFVDVGDTASEFDAADSPE